MPDKMEDDICTFCGKPATKLCDFPIGYPHWAGHTPKGLEIYDSDGKEITGDIPVCCSRPICDECTTEWEDLDFCPICVEKIMREIIIKREAKKSQIKHASRVNPFRSPKK